MKEEILAVIHTLIMIVAWLSPFWLDWKIVFTCLVLYELQIYFFNGCIIANYHFNKNIRKRSEKTMTEYWLSKLSIKTNRKILNFMSDYGTPMIILIVTIIWQILLKNGVLIRI